MDVIQGGIFLSVQFMLTSFPLGQVESSIPSDKSPGSRLDLLSTPSRFPEKSVASCGFRAVYSCGAAPAFTGFLGSDRLSGNKEILGNPFPGLRSIVTRVSYTSRMLDSVITSSGRPAA